jgi:hypothetical protein
MRQECVANKSWIRPAYIGTQAVVVGAGIAGIAAAKVLADWLKRSSSWNTIFCLTPRRTGRGRPKPGIRMCCSSAANVRSRSCSPRSTTTSRPLAAFRCGSIKISVKNCPMVGRSRNATSA